MTSLGTNLSHNPIEWGSDSGTSKFEEDGTYVATGDGTVWVDIDFPIVIRTVAANVPILKTLQGNILVPQWQVNDYVICEGQELIHKWKEGSEVFWHVHIITNGTDITDRYINWEIEYTWVNTNGVLESNTTITNEIIIPANTPDRTMLIMSIGSFTPINGNIGGHVFARLRRIASTGTAPAGDPFCSMLQLHVECDTIGSREISSK